MTRDGIAERLAGRYERRWLREYVRWKVRSDPAYEAAFESLRGESRPLVDVGCGLGLLVFYLRERGYAGPITGIDFDRRKIGAAQRVGAQYRDVSFVAGDAREPLPADHNVVILDLLQYVDDASQQRILDNAARAVPPGGVIVMRQGVRDRSWRSRLTAFVDVIGRAIRWMQGGRINHPTMERLMNAFDGFERDVHPLWGTTPYNNYLFVFRKPAATDAATAREAGRRAE